MTTSKNIYSLPFNKKNLIKAVSDPRAHFAHSKHAIDFVLPIGTKILAPKAGTVVDIKVNSNKGGFHPKYNDIKYLNYITLKHSNREFSQFGHLKHKGSLVKVGDKVKKNQPIAISGNTGFTTTPHLHFQVFKLNQNKIGWETIKIKFKENIHINRSTKPLPKKLRKTLKELKKYQ